MKSLKLAKPGPGGGRAAVRIVTGECPHLYGFFQLDLFFSFPHPQSNLFLNGF
jgi:hypothetical protein